MRTLRLVGLSDDGRSLLLALEGADGDEERFVLPVEDRLREVACEDARLHGQI